MNRCPTYSPGEREHEAKLDLPQAGAANQRPAPAGDYAGEDRAKSGVRDCAGDLSGAGQHDHSLHPSGDHLSSESAGDSVGELSCISRAIGPADSVYSFWRDSLPLSACVAFVAIHLPDDPRECLADDQDLLDL